MKLYAPFLALPLLFGAAAPHLAAQDAGGSATPVVSIADVRIESFVPQHVAATNLYHAANKTVGRSLYIEERGGLQGEPAENLALVGDRLLVYDRPEYVEVILQALAELDQPSANAPSTTALVAAEYAPRYITLRSVSEALQSFESHRMSQGVAQVRNVSFVDDRNVVILRDTREAVDEMLAVLRKIDAPEPQATFTCYVVRGDGGGDGDGAMKLPEGLKQSLGELLPQLELGAAGFGMLRSSVAPDRRVELRIEGKEDGFDLSLAFSAFDPETKSLTVQSCRLERDQYQTVTDGSGGEQQRLVGKRQVFTTNAVLRGGEYTVLGASGAEPLFLVVRFTPIP